jgi:hypothetical protein
LLLAFSLDWLMKNNQVDLFHIPKDVSFLGITLILSHVHN